MPLEKQCYEKLFQKLQTQSLEKESEVYLFCPFDGNDEAVW